MPSQLTVAQQSVWLVTVLSETADPITRAASDVIKIAFMSRNVPGLRQACWSHYSETVAGQRIKRNKQATLPNDRV